MAPQALPSPQHDEGLDPALLRVIEALARAHVEEDYAAAQAGERKRD
ncbi:hypothetical protein BH11PSE1_BH11PSE1_10490 [soil metagenome]